MDFLRSPKSKLYLAIALLAVLGLAASSRGLDLVTASRWLLGGGCLVVLGFFMMRRRQAASSFAPLPRLTVLARTGLSPRCGLALVEADGRTLLVAYGDGFAQFADAPGKKVSVKPAQPCQGRRVAPRPRRSRKAVAP